MGSVPPGCSSTGSTAMGSALLWGRAPLSFSDPPLPSVLISQLNSSSFLNPLLNLPPSPPICQFHPIGKPQTWPAKSWELANIAFMGGGGRGGAVRKALWEGCDNHKAPPPPPTRQHLIPLSSLC